MARQLGYADYTAMQNAAAQGQTIIDGGYIRTDLINASAIEAGSLAVTDANNMVTVKPNSGLQLFKSTDGGASYTKTVEFRGEEKDGLADIIPNYKGASILISEKIIDARLEAVRLKRKPFLLQRPVLFLGSGEIKELKQENRQLYEEVAIRDESMEKLQTMMQGQQKHHHKELTEVQAKHIEILNEKGRISSREKSDR